MPPRARAVMPINRPPASARSCGISFVAPEAREDTMDAATKDELLNQAARDYKAFHETLAGLNEAQMSEVWLGTWSVKDIVAPISGWHPEMGPALERLAPRGKPLPPRVASPGRHPRDPAVPPPRKGP